MRDGTLVHRRMGKRVGGLAYWRIGVWESKTAFRHGYSDQEVSTELMMLCKRRRADTPTRRHVSPKAGAFAYACKPMATISSQKLARQSLDDLIINIGILLSRDPLSFRTLNT